MTPEVQQLIEAIHSAARPFVYFSAGGGASAAGMLLSIPGGSRSVLEVVIPYHPLSMSELLGHPALHACSLDSTRELARQAYQRARKLAPEARTFGLAVTAALATDRPRKGDHRFHVCVCDCARERTVSLKLKKDARSRPAEEEVIDLVLLNTLAEFLNLPERVEIPLLAGEAPAIEIKRLDPITDLLEGTVPALERQADGRLAPPAESPAAILSGSFNPIHEGHMRLAEVAAELLHKPVHLELTVVNAEKGHLTEAEVRRRLSLIGWRRPVLLTRAPTFLEKARLFPGTIFIVGADTAVRIVQPCFYNEDAAEMLQALQTLKTLKCQFLVAGRREKSGSFLELASIEIPNDYRSLFTAIPRESFEVHIASRNIRGESP